MTRIIPVLGDQLSINLSSLNAANKLSDIVLMSEVKTEATYVKHHKKKIAFLFSAMRHFAKQLQNDGYNVKYITLNHPDNKGSLGAQVAWLANKFNSTEILITEPGEYRLMEEMKNWENQFAVPVTILEDDRFLASKAQFNQWAAGKKQLRMEFFYREMRKRYDVLMEQGKPIQGKWNFDVQNRKKLKADATIPPPFQFKPDKISEDVITMVAEHFAEHFGDLQPFHYAVTRDQALEVLDHFLVHRLPQFGDYQDAMLVGEDWLFHSHLSFYLNSGLLDPKEVIEAAETQFHLGQAPINAVEGFIRQILGWREYVRGLYWWLMPDYKSGNFLNAEAPLPEFFWNGDTQMRCLNECIRTTKENAYAHHIQRLMVIGNFLLLTGVSPEAVNNWYLLVYADAYEWVELPNVNGMILFADGGVLASKPYAASGSYINKMSNYCQKCIYNVKEKSGERACPFNYLYWNFLDKHSDKLQANPRMALIYKALQNKTSEERQIIKQHSERFLIKLTNNEKV